MYYVDNEAAKFVLIKGNSPTRDSAWLVQHFWEKEANLECYSWFERVPSASNIADYPSRGVLVVDLGGLRSSTWRLPKIFEARLVNDWVAWSR